MSKHYQQIEQALTRIASAHGTVPALSDLAADVGLSEFHFHRVFVAWAGVTTKEFHQALNVARARATLASNSLLDTALELGLSGPSRLHDAFLSVERMTPGEARLGGRGLTISWALAETAFGLALFAHSARGLCRLAFVADAQAAQTELAAHWPHARLLHDPLQLAPVIAEVQRRMSGETPRERLGILLQGSEFRVAVWLALLRVPPGELVSYQALASASGRPDAVRAAASAVANNALAYLIPCHRVIRATGVLGDYRWGSARKIALVGREALRA